MAALSLCVGLVRSATGQPLVLAEPAAPCFGAFGWAVATMDDDVIIGAPLSCLHVVDGGAVYRMNPTTGALVATYHSPDPGQGDYFGLALATDATRVFVAAPQTGEGSDGRGVVHVFDAESGMPLHAVQAPPDAWGFGLGLARAGDLLVVSAWFVGESSRGVIYVYDAATFALLRTIVPPPWVERFDYGVIATDGERIAIATDTAALGIEPGRRIVHVLDARTGTLLYVIEPSSLDVPFRFAESLDLASGRLAIGTLGWDGEPGTISVHDFTDGARVQHVTGTGCTNFGEFVVLDGDAALVPCGSRDRELAQLIDVASGVPLARYATGESGGGTAGAVFGDRVVVGIADLDLAYVFSRPVCGDGVRTHAEECDDGNVDDGDCCDPVCRFEARGTSCGEGDLCTTPVCDGAGACAPSPGDACVPASSPAGAFLELRRAGRTRWRFQADAGPTPGTSIDYALCVFDVPAGRLMTGLELPSGAQCGRRPCWSSSHDGSAFRGEAARLKLRRAPDGGTRIRLQARDLTLASNAMPAVEPLDVRVELRNAAGQCWASQHVAATRNEARVLRTLSR